MSIVDTILPVLLAYNPNDHRVMYTKSQGGVANLFKNFDKSSIDGHVGMGHTRWSTHGVSSTENAHPHFDCEKAISIVHNGIIENHHELKKHLVALWPRFSVPNGY